jgi:hypothetical protein
MYKFPQQQRQKEDVDPYEVKSHQEHMNQLQATATAKKEILQIHVHPSGTPRILLCSICGLAYKIPNVVERIGKHFMMKRRMRHCPLVHDKTNYEAVTDEERNNKRQWNNRHHANKKANT